MKRIISLVLSLSIVMSLFGGLDISVFATTETSSISKTELIDIDVYKAQCLAGIANDPNSDAVEHCNALYNYYIDEELFSPTQTFLDEAYADDELMAEFALWQLYSLGADSSTIVNVPVQRKDYYESLIMAVISQTLNENSRNNADLYIKVAGYATTMIDGLCNISNATNKLELLDKFPDVTAPETKAAFESLFNSNPKLGTCDVIDIILGFSSTILDAIDRIAAYNTMLSLDNYTKQWLECMYNSCDSGTDVALKDALFNLKNSSSSFTEAVMVDIKDSSFRLANWSISTTINVKLSLMASTNPLTTALLAGLKLGKTISDICFSASDVCEQFFLLECIYDIQDLARKVTNDSNTKFVESQTKENASSFIYAVDFYFESIINTDIDCMGSFLDTLYNGGILKGIIKWMYGATDDYQEAINALESLREVRQNNYDLMTTYFKIALAVNYPDTYDYYFTVDNTIPITDISFMTSRILPPPYPAGYANMIVGDFANINVQYVPSNTTQRAYTVTSDNPGVVSVNDNVMTAVSVGTANVTVTSIENPTVSFTAEIKVGEKIEDGEIEEITTWFTYTVDENDNATITGLIDGYEPSTLVIPSTIKGYSVTKIGTEAFLDCTFIKSVEMPNSVKSIGDSVFSGCTNLNNIRLSDSITRIGSGWTGDGRCAFLGCSSLEKIIIPDSVTTIGAKSFFGCTSLKELVMPCSVDFENDSFLECSNIERVTLTKGNGIMPNYYFNVINSSTDNGAPWSASKNSIKEIILCDGVVKIGICSFLNCTGVEKIVIPDSVTTIEEYAFMNCDNLLDITIPNNITEIDQGVFSGCDNLKSVKLPNGLLTIKSSAFSNCDSLAAIELPETLTSIGDRVFSSCDNLNCITIPSNVTSIGDWCFDSCSALEYAYYQGDISEWVNISFGGQGSNPMEYAQYVYIDDELVTDVVIPEGVTTIGLNAFRNCTTLNSIEIPNSVSTIGPLAFFYCDNLKYVTIGNGCTTIDSSAFEGCNNIVDLHYTGTVDNWCKITFADSTSNPMKYASNEYFNGDLVTDIVIDGNAEKINDFAFANCNSLYSVSISDSVSTIGAYAFDNCTSLNSIVIGSNVVTIDEYAFEHCMSLIRMDVNEDNLHYSSDEHGVLYNKDKTILILYPCGKEDDSYTVPEGVMRVGNDAFSDCNNIEKIIIANGVTTIGTGAFEYCNNLSEIVLPNSIVEIGSWAFYNSNGWILKDIFYGGTENDWNAVMSKSSYTGIGDSVRVHYESDDNHYTIKELQEETCTEEGKTIYDCSCGYEKTEYIPASGHNYEFVEKTEPTCDWSGYTMYYCKKCDQHFTDDYVAALGHTEDELIESVLPTCTQKGYNKYSCSVCDSEFYVYIDKLEHIKEEVESNSATCTVGATTRYYCSRGDHYIWEESGSGNGHSFVDGICSICGVDDRWTYSFDVSTGGICIGGYSGSESSIIIPNEIEGYSVTCIGEFAFSGNTNITSIIFPESLENIGICAFQGCSSISSITIPEKVTNIGDSAFDDTNIRTVVYNATKCYMSYYDKCLDPSSVDYNDSYAVWNGFSIFPNCTEIIFGDNVTFIPTSLVANNTNLTSITLPENLQRIQPCAFRACANLVNLTFSENISSIGFCAFENTLWLDNQPDGLLYIGKVLYDFIGYGGNKVISIKGGTVSISDNALDDCYNLISLFIPDSLVSVGNSALSDCYSLSHIIYEGSMQDWSSMKIGYSNTILESITKHYDCTSDVLVSILTKPTCEDDGDIKYTCELCELEIIEQLEALGHNGVAIETIAPTCTNDGYTVYQCSECGETYNADWVYSTGHTKGDVVESVVPSCTQDGYTRYNCSVCGVTFTTDWVWAQGHTKGEIVSIVDPTCEESGYTIYSCSVCSLTFKSDWIYSSGHTQGTVIEVVEATCTEDGYTKYKCSSCNEEFIDNWTYATGHSGEAMNSVNATCIEKGYTEFLCDSCGETYNSDFTSPLGHVFENDICINCNKAKEDCIESSHNYENNCDETWIISKPNADYITITFSSATETERGWDYIYIYDMNDNLIGQYSGTELASQTITVTGNIVKIRLTSDSSVNKYGFAVSDICSYIKITVNDVEVAMPENAVDSTAELRVNEIDINNIVAVLPEEFDVATANVYDIYFEKDEQRVQPNGAVTVYIPVPSDIDGEKCKVFHIDESGNATDMNAVYENGYMMFTTDHFSYYALVEEQVGFVYGDANGDTVIDGRDVVRLKNYLANYDYDTETSTVEIFDGADANGDGIIDGRDVIRLKNYLANYDYDTDSSTVVLGPQN